MTPARHELGHLLRTLHPVLAPAPVAFCLLPPGADPRDAAPIATFREAEGLTVIVREEVARRHGWAIAFRAAWITLTVDSALESVGLTAAVATALAGAGISCNVVAAIHHDHLFVPYERGEAALAILSRLQDGAMEAARPARSAAGLAPKTRRNTSP